MKRIAIVSGARTPMGKYGGAFKEVHPADLAATVIREAVSRAGIEPAKVDEVIMGHVLVNGETPNIARQATLKAGFPH